MQATPKLRQKAAEISEGMRREFARLADQAISHRQLIEDLAQ